MTDYPHKPGHRGVDTSIAAAAAFAPKQKTHQNVIEGALERAGANGATADDVAEALGEGWNVYKVRPRLPELKHLNRIMDSGQTRESKCGIKSTVYVHPSFMEGEADAQ
jgi:hypothetical protein